MCSRMCDKPAPRCWSSSMLPVAHHACTLATGALRSSWTMIVSPFGRTHFRAELGGKAITGEGSAVAALRLTIINNRTAEENFASGMRHIDYRVAGGVPGDQSLPITFSMQQAWVSAIAPEI